ncbi:hypothetical protein Tco_1354551 [Tanacetum coccineum]
MLNIVAVKAIALLLSPSVLDIATLSAFFDDQPNIPRLSPRETVILPDVLSELSLTDQHVWICLLAGEVLNGVIHCLLGYLLSFRELPAKPKLRKSEGDITRVNVFGFDGTPGLQPVAPPSPVVNTRSTITTISSDEGMTEDDHEFPAEEQPLPPVDSPTAESPGYVTESDPEEDPEEYEDDKTEDGPEDDEDEEEEEEHLAPADSTVVPADGPVSPPEGTEPVIPPPSTDITVGARITVRPQASALIDAVTAALPSSPLPPLPPSLYIPLPVDYRDDIPESEQPPRKRLYLSTLGSRYEVGESSTARPTRSRGIDYGFISTVDAEERRQGIRDVGYGIRDTWVDSAEAVPEIAPMTVGEVNTRITELAELYEHDTQDLYASLEDAQDRDSMDGKGGGLCFPIGLGSLDRIESGTSDTATAIEYSHSDTTSDIRREMSDMQAELLALREQQRRARQPGPEARIPDHQDASGDADSHI